MRPATSITLCMATIVVVVSAAIGERVVNRQASTDRVTVIYWEKWNGPEGDSMRKVVSDFNKSQKRIFVRYLSISGVDQKTLLATAGGNPPDVAGIWLDQVCQFSDAKALTDLRPMFDAAGLKPDHYIKGYWDGLNYRGGLWALPSTPASMALHVRTDLVPSNVNSPETFPKTIEGMDAIVDQISKKDEDGNLILAGYLPGNPGWWNYAWGPLWGGKLIEGDKITLNSPENVKSFEWIASYAKRFGSKEVQSFQSGFGNFASPQDPFITGKVAMEINGPWKANYIESYQDKKKPVHWFAVPFPYPAAHPELAGHTILSQDVLTIPRGAKHPKEAFEFMAYVQRQDVMEGLCIAHTKNSPLNKVSEEFFRKHKNPYIRLFDQLARSPGAIQPPQIGVYTQMGGEIGNAFQEVNTGQKGPKEALDDAQARVTKQWKTYREQILGEKL